MTRKRMNCTSFSFSIRKEITGLNCSKGGLGQILSHTRQELLGLGMWGCKEHMSV